MVSQAKYKSIHGAGLKILTCKQILWRLPKKVTQLKAGNTSENLLHEFKQIAYSLYWEKKLLKKCIITWRIQ